MTSENTGNEQNIPFDYIDEAHVTCSGSYYADRVDAGVLFHALQNFIEAAETLDVIKKTLFYGRELGHIPKALREDADETKVADHFDSNIIHGIIGIATESGELVEALVAKMFGGKDFDTVNMAEETGDVFWYAALLARKAGVTFSDIQKNNIEKLRKRFPDKFTEYDANNRDLTSERAILEKMISAEKAQDEFTKTGDIDGASEAYWQVVKSGGTENRNIFIDYGVITADKMAIGGQDIYDRFNAIEDRFNFLESQVAALSYETNYATEATAAAAAAVASALEKGGRKG